jgi:hypothetical protein
MDLSPDELIAANASLTNEQAENLGLRSVTDGGSLFCLKCLTMPFAIGGVRHAWPKGMTVSWHIGMTRLGSLSDLDMKGARERTCAEIEGLCGLKLKYNPNGKTANLLATAVRMDGASMVLADHQIPMGVNADSQLLGRFDTSENWVLSRTAVPNAIDFERTDKHELAHGLGFGHGQVIKSNPAMLEPMYSWSIFMYQPRDVEEFVARYGGPTVAPTIPTPTTEFKTTVEASGFRVELTLNPTSAGVAAKVVAHRDGKSATLSGSKNWA